MPEIASGTVVIKAIAREPGFRTKIAVVSNEQGVDPIGACVGQRGTRIMAVINELGGEKIDVIEWQEKPEKFITNALAPAKVVEVKVEDKNTAIVFVPEDQIEFGNWKRRQKCKIGRQLTGWKIDIKTDRSSSRKEKRLKTILLREVEGRRKTKAKKAKKTKKSKERRRRRMLTKKKPAQMAKPKKNPPPKLMQQTEEKPAENPTEEDNNTLKIII